MAFDQKNHPTICPYLGNNADHQTALAYPSVVNRCCNAKPVVGVALQHQEKFCLSPQHINCEEYSATPGKPLPIALRLIEHGRGRRKIERMHYGWGVGLLVLIVLCAYLSIYQGKHILQAFEKPENTKIAMATMIPNTPVNVTSTQPPAATNTIEITSQATSGSRPVLSLETPLGIDKKFLIHQIQEGDSLDRVASLNGSSATVLQACNFRLPSPLFPGWAIVVPLNTLDPKGIPSFEVYAVKENIKAADLAQRLSVNLQKFTYYNAFSENFELQDGDWVLVPR